MARHFLEILVTFMLLMIDNYDSFTYNIVQYLNELGSEVRVVSNDELDLAGVAALQPERIIISPGPCTPGEAGISVDLIKAFAGELPILGICLGHQAIGEAFGGAVVRARQVMHGKVCSIHHRNQGLFAGVAAPFAATRYNSLVVDRLCLPDCLEITAWTQTDDGRFDEIMGIKHRDYPVTGVQFHPESILSEHGHQLLRNFLQHTQ